MVMIPSTETQVIQQPKKFAMAEPSKLLTFIKGEPPMNAGKGRRRNPVVTEIYNQLITNRNEWAHLNIPIPDKKTKNNIIASLYSRARKDNLYLSTTSVYNEKTKMFDLWVMLTA